MRPMSKNNRDINRKATDESLGRALAKALAEAKAPGKCLSDEDFAELLDGTKPEDERESLLAHLASCDDCLARYTVAAGLHVPQATTGRRSWYRYAAGLTAVAAVLVAVIMARHQTVPETAKNRQLAGGGTVQTAPATGKLPSPALPERPIVAQQRPQPQESARRGGETAVALAGAVYDQKETGVGGPRSAEKSYGFSGGTTDAKRAFRTGMASIDLAAALKSGSAAARDEVLANLADLTGTGSVKTGISEFLREDAQKSERQRYLHLVATIERHAEQNGQALSFHFGAWSAAGRLLDNRQLKEFVDLKSVRAFKERIKGDDMPEAARRSLDKLEGLVESTQGSEKDMRLIRRTLNEIIEIY